MLGAKLLDQFCRCCAELGNAAPMQRAFGHTACTREPCNIELLCRVLLGQLERPPELTASARLSEQCITELSLKPRSARVDHEPRRH